MSQNAPPTPPSNPPAPDDRDPAFAAWMEDPTNAAFTRKLRQEAGTYRVRAREAERQRDALDPDGSGRITLAKHEAENRQLRIDNAVLRTAHELGIGDLRRLRFELHESSALNNLDPGDEHFGDDIRNVIEELSEAIPDLKRGGPQGAPAPLTGAQIRPGPAPEFITRNALKNMTPEEVEAAKSAGLLDRLLGRV